MNYYIEETWSLLVLVRRGKGGLSACGGWEISQYLHSS